MLFFLFTYDVFYLYFIFMFYKVSKEVKTLYSETAEWPSNLKTFQK